MTPDPYYHILLNFTPYIQLMAAVDFGLLLLESRSITVKFQKRILNLQIDHYKPILKEAGQLTQRCQERRYARDEGGRTILGLADSIRKRKEVFMTDTELEKQSAFMPALGLTSGMFCLLYLLLVPFVISNHSESCLYWLEYSAEAVSIGQLMVILTYMLLPQYRGYLASLAICLTWVLIDLAISLVLYIFGCNIVWGSFGIYEFQILLVPSTPILFLIVRLILMLIDRRRRINRIAEDVEKLDVYVKNYRS